jgi:hypothetical protein
MAVDQVIQIAPDSSGKKIDNSELTRADGTVVERQRINIGSPTDVSWGGLAEVSQNNLGTYDVQSLAILRKISQQLEQLLIVFTRWTGTQIPDINLEE